MTRARTILTWAAFLGTFPWLWIGDVRHSPAALWPSVLAVGLAFLTRDIYLALFLGSFSGAILLRGGNVGGAFLDLFDRHLLPALTDPWNISVLVFTLMMGGLVEVLNRSGSMEAMAARMLGSGGSRRRVGLGVYAMGWAVFFDGLASAMLVGKTMRPVADRAGMSRAKLSFLVDSTSSPIAGVALISTWIAYEMSVIRQGFEQVGDAGLTAWASPYQLLVQSLPYRFYNYYVLWLVLLTIWLDRDLGPMREAERQTAEAARRARHEAGSAPDAEGWRVWLALVPLAALVAGVFGGLYVEGGGWAGPLSWGGVVEAFSKADAAKVFVWATAAASVLAVGLAAVFPARDRQTSALGSYLTGLKNMFLPALILVFAWVLNGVIKEMGAASYLVSWLGDRLPSPLLPALVFLLGALMSFSTGTSWGTMALLMPLVIPLAVRLTGAEAGTAFSPTFVAAVGAVLAGAVFGDHCSPISDTTIVSAFSSDCDVMEHVRTQMPYALIGAGLAVVLGYAPGGWGVPVWLLLFLGGAACWLLLRYGGEPRAAG